MTERLAAVKTVPVETEQRVIAVSDIHGNLPYLKGLLAKLNFGGNDLLIVVGDFLEKGEHSLETLRFLMELSGQGRAQVLLGNCDGWHDIFDSDGGDEHIRYYLTKKKRGLLWDMLCEQGIDPCTLTSLAERKPLLSGAYAKEFAFLRALPQIIETPMAVFAHAALSDALPLTQQPYEAVLRCDAFWKTGRRFPRWVVVGHWPVVLYHENIVDANPILDEEAHIISIDGGCVLKDDGQLNAVIFENGNIRTEYYDDFPRFRVKTAQAEGERSYYIRWGDSTVEVLERGEEFSLCRHVRTGYELRILTKFLFTDERITGCNDCTDRVLPLAPGDIVSVTEKTSEGFLVKHNGVSGWYCGELEEIK